MNRETQQILLATIPSLVTVIAQKVIRRPQNLKGTTSLTDLTSTLLSPQIFEIVWPVMLLISGILIENLKKNNPGYRLLLANIVCNIAFVIFSALGNKQLSLISLVLMVISIISFMIVNNQKGYNWVLIPYLIFVFILVIIMTVLDKLKTFVESKFGENSTLAKILDILEKFKN